VQKVLFFLIPFFFITCNDSNNQHIEIEFERFEDIFSASDINSLAKVKQDFPFLFPSQFEDQIWIDRLSDTIQNEIFKEVKLSFSDFSVQKNSIQLFYDNYLKYNIEYKIPRIITLTTDVDYTKKIILTDSLLLIGLDNYLGKSHFFYSSFPEYLRSTFIKENIVIDIAKEYASSSVYNEKLDNYTFIEKIINQGKILYFTSAMLPETQSSKIIGYSIEDYAWALNNEKDIWSNFIENNHLFSTDNNLDTRFIGLAPFSKFYLSIDNESPSMIGKYIGWQIVKSFMNANNYVNLKDLIQGKPMYIYNNSKYKPYTNE